MFSGYSANLILIIKFEHTLVCLCPSESVVSNTDYNALYIIWPEQSKVELHFPYTSYNTFINIV